MKKHSSDLYPIGFTPKNPNPYKWVIRLIILGLLVLTAIFFFTLK